MIGEDLDFYSAYRALLSTSLAPPWLEIVHYMHYVKELVRYMHYAMETCYRMVDPDCRS